MVYLEGKTGISIFYAIFNFFYTLVRRNLNFPPNFPFILAFSSKIGFEKKGTALKIAKKKYREMRQ